MRLSLRESSYPEYRALRDQSTPWVWAWLIGHGLMFIALMAVFAGTIGVGLAAMIDPEIGSARAWSAARAIVGSGIFYGLIGFLLKRYAVKKGTKSGDPDEPRT